MMIIRNVVLFIAAVVAVALASHFAAAQSGTFAKSARVSTTGKTSQGIAIAGGKLVAAPDSGGTLYWYKLSDLTAASPASTAQTQQTTVIKLVVQNGIVVAFGDGLPTRAGSAIISSGANGPTWANSSCGDYIDAADAWGTNKVVGVGWEYDVDYPRDIHVLIVSTSAITHDWSRYISLQSATHAVVIGDYLFAISASTIGIALMKYDLANKLEINTITTDTTFDSSAPSDIKGLAKYGNALLLFGSGSTCRIYKWTNANVAGNIGAPNQKHNTKTSGTTCTLHHGAVYDGWIFASQEGSTNPNIHQFLFSDLSYVASAAGDSNYQNFRYVVSDGAGAIYVAMFNTPTAAPIAAKFTVPSTTVAPATTTTAAPSSASAVAVAAALATALLVCVVAAF